MLVKKILNEHGIVSDDDYAIDINKKINQFSMNFLDEYWSITVRIFEAIR